MGDLAQAIVDLGINADRRRQARKDLRESVEVVVGELLRHLRVGDDVQIKADDESLFEFDRTYVVERITWDCTNVAPRLPDDDEAVRPTTITHQKGATTLVRYDGATKYAMHGDFKGAVLVDVRVPLVWDESHWRGPVEHPVAGRGVYVLPAADDIRLWQPKLHLATDIELALFADDALDVVRMLTSEQAMLARRYAEAAATITKLSPR